MLVFWVAVCVGGFGVQLIVACWFVKCLLIRVLGCVC